MVDKNIFYNTVIWNRILITADDINKSLNTTIQNILVENNEGKCVREGFIKEGSIKLLKRSVPYVYGNQMNGKLYVDVLYETEICCPMRGNVIECKIEKINKLGILAYIKYKDIIENGKNNGIGESPLLIIIPMETIDDIDKYDDNMKIKVVVKATRVKFDANKIQVIGNIED